MLQFSPGLSGLSGGKSRFLFSPVEPPLNALVSIISIYYISGGENVSDLSPHNNEVNEKC